MSSTLFGEHLRREREMRGVSLEEISAATRIGTRFLEAIENDQWDQLPGGVFNRGFIRSIARFLGLDEDSLVAEYALGTNGKTDAHKAAERPAEIPRNWGPAAIAAAVAIAVLLLSGLVVRQYYGRWIRARLHRQHAEAVAGPLGRVVPGMRSSEATPSLATGPPMPGVEDTVALRTQADKPAEVSVSAHGETVFAVTVNANDARRFRARETFEITSNDSGAARLELNGQTMPPPGASGQPGSQTLAPENLSTRPGEAH